MLLKSQKHFLSASRLFHFYNHLLFDSVNQFN